MTTLTKDRRKTILANVITHRFKADFLELYARRADLANLVYDNQYTEAQHELIAKCPNNWLSERAYTNAVFGGSATTLDFNGQSLLDVEKWVRRFKELIYIQVGQVYKRVPNLNYATCQTFSTGTEARELYDEVYAEEATLMETFGSTVVEAEAVLGSVTTIKKLLTAWPEIEDFIPQKFMTLKNNEVALVSSNLNNKLNLPKEEV
tara:strand:+ start:2572 stop:3189 length:618 start_codon:yes stop_codon:yes gene_type:complete